jgi:polyphosphate kinase 2 (PPK2 family)
MFESAELGHTVDDARYAKEVEELRADLLDAQYALLEDRSFPIILLVNGVDGAGKGESVNLLNEWLDPRHVRSRAFGEPDESERMRPPMWRFWQALPPKGKIGVLFGSWYTDPINGRARDEISQGDLTGSLDRIRSFEQMLVDDGAVIVKLWFHLSKKGQKKRLAELERDKLTSWRVTKEDWKNYAQYDRFREVSELVLRETSTGAAPWLVIDGSDPNYRALTAGRALLAALQSRLGDRLKPKSKSRKSTNGKAAPISERSGAAVGLLRTVDTAAILENLKFEERLSKEDYGPKMAKLQAKLGRLARSERLKKKAVVMVFEGMDAAGSSSSSRSPRPPTRSARSRTSGASGGSCRDADSSASSIDPGTAASSSSASSASRPRRRGHARTTRSTSSRSSSPSTASSS